MSASGSEYMPTEEDSSDEELKTSTRQRRVGEVSNGSRRQTRRSSTQTAMTEDVPMEDSDGSVEDEPGYNEETYLSGFNTGMLWKIAILPERGKFAPEFWKS